MLSEASFCVASFCVAAAERAKNVLVVPGIAAVCMVSLAGSSGLVLGNWLGSKLCTIYAIFLAQPFREMGPKCQSNYCRQSHKLITPE